MTVMRAIGLFVIAGLCEIGGGWLIWQWIRNGRSPWWGLVGGVVLILYGIVPTLQRQYFSRTYAAYGGFFILLALGWGWIMDGNVPDRMDIIGALIALTGVLIMYFWPR